MRVAVVREVIDAAHPRLGTGDDRPTFGDASGRVFTPAVTDLACRSYLDRLRDGEGLSPPVAARRVRPGLRKAKAHYSGSVWRGWADHSERCCL